MLCQICRFDVELDDVAIPRREPWCICVRCYYRECDGMKEWPTYLRGQVQKAIDGDDSGPVGITFDDAFAMQKQRSFRPEEPGPERTHS